jgi:26S proteasome regulatory subunit N2
LNYYWRIAAYDELSEGLFTDSAVASEAAAYAMGLVMLGFGKEKAPEEMLSYAHETQHEKSIRGLAISVAFLYYGRQESADGVIETLNEKVDTVLNAIYFKLTVVYRTRSSGW